MSDDKKQFAVVFLCMLKDHYVIGTCIAAYIHRYLISLQHRNVKLILMCDKYIYDKWFHTLSKYFDEIIQIDLITFPLSSNYSFVMKKYDWLQYSLSKWYCLKFITFSKVLFCDVDMIPVDSHFYDIFDFNTPAVLNTSVSANKCHNNSPISHILVPYPTYIQNNTVPYGSCDGGLVLLEPDLQLYDDYMNFVSHIYKNGIYSVYHSGPDETSLFYFLLSRGNVYRICEKYSCIPWESSPDIVNDALLYNFLSFIKPWNKARILQWNEEILWSDLFDLLPPDLKLQKLHDKQILDTYNNFIKLSYRDKKKYFNSENFSILTPKTLFSFTKKLKKYGNLNIKSLKNLLHLKN